MRKLNCHICDCCRKVLVFYPDDVVEKNGKEFCGPGCAEAGRIVYLPCGHSPVVGWGLTDAEASESCEDCAAVEQGLVKLVLISDMHGQHGRLKVPDGDILVVAGDFTTQGSFTEIANFNGWLGGLPHKHKIVIAGNHDVMFEKDPGFARSLITNAIYLQDEGVEVMGLKFWGSPWTPFFCNWAFNLRTGEERRQKWERIPEGLDVLITHGPPAGILDRTYDGEHVGCSELLAKLASLESEPRLHVFGHIHEAAGRERHPGFRTEFVNAGALDGRYVPKDQLQIVYLKPRV
jgi:Icc-related predicted phosphoesterase